MRCSGICKTQINDSSVFNAFVGFLLVRWDWFSFLLFFFSCKQSGLKMARLAGQRAFLPMTASGKISIKFSMDFCSPKGMIYNHLCHPFILCHYLVKYSPMTDNGGIGKVFQEAGFPFFNNPILILFFLIYIVKSKFVVHLLMVMLWGKVSGSP